jgi:Tfp pilus assembly protein PilX
MHLRSRLADQRGSALVPALLITAILLGFGMASMQLVDGQQRDSRRERERESSFQLAEGVLNAEIYRLSTRWPGKTLTAYPSVCTATSTHPDCPGGATLSANFQGPDYNRPTSWKVQVRDNEDTSTSTKTNFYSEAQFNASADYKDANGDNFLWVRAEADVAGRKRVLVALVEAENVTLNFPNATLVAGKFEVSNSGKKVMIDTNGVNNEWTPGDIIVRCALSDPKCADWDQGKGQIEPATIRSNPLQPKAVSPEALDQLRARAQAEGNYYTGCAPSLQGVNGPGGMVFMEDADGCHFNGNQVYNSPTKPGYVVIAKGTPTLNGNAEFYGVIYHANEAESSDMLINMKGNISIFGSIVIDGAGGLSAGSSKVNLVYNPNAFAGLQAFGTAGLVQNTFREVDGV